MELLDKKLGGTAPLDLIINSPKEIEILKKKILMNLKMILVMMKNLMGTGGIQLI